MAKLKYEGSSPQFQLPDLLNGLAWTRTEKYYNQYGVKLGKHEYRFIDISGDKIIDLGKYDFSELDDIYKRFEITEEDNINGDHSFFVAKCFFEDSR